jgi:hypothetical protein
MRLDKYPTTYSTHQTPNDMLGCATLRRALMDHDPLLVWEYAFPNVSSLNGGLGANHSFTWRRGEITGSHRTRNCEAGGWESQDTRGHPTTCKPIACADSNLPLYFAWARGGSLLTLSMRWPTVENDLSLSILHQRNHYLCWPPTDTLTVLGNMFRLNGEFGHIKAFLRDLRPPPPLTN